LGLTSTIDYPGFSQDRVNFHKKPLGDTDWLADPNRPTKCGIRYYVTSCLVCWVGELAGGKLNTARECAGHWVVRVAPCITLLILYIILLNTIVVTVHFLCCSFKLSLSWHTTFAFFFPLSSPPQRGHRW